MEQVTQDENVFDMEVSNLTDHDLLTTLNIKMDLLSKQFTNHLRHHWVITIMCLTCALTGVFSLATGITLLVVKYLVG